MEQELPESLPVTKIDWDYDICEHTQFQNMNFSKN